MSPAIAQLTESPAHSDRARGGVFDLYKNIGNFCAFMFGGYETIEQAAETESDGNIERYIATFIDGIPPAKLAKAEQYLATKAPSIKAIESLMAANDWFIDGDAKPLPAELAALQTIMDNWD